MDLETKQFLLEWSIAFLIALMWVRIEDRIKNRKHINKE